MKKINRSVVLTGKNLRYMFFIIIALILSSGSSTLYAQVHLSIHFNLGSQPDWGPSGYDYVEYYYLPGIDVYYCVPSHCYYYNNGGYWVRSEYLPPRYHNYDVYNSYKVVLNERDPWRHDREYREKYYSYRNQHDQPNIRDDHQWDNGRRHGKENHDSGHENDHGNHDH